MDERQTQIREGAGLEESRLNTELIDWLRKWSTPVLLVIAALALGYFLYGKWQQAQAAKVDAAFAELNAEEASGNPEALVRVAEAHPGQPGVVNKARLEAADTFLRAGVTGIRPGFTPADDGSIPADAQLTEEERQRMFTRAGELYKQVVDATENASGKFYFAIEGLHGMAAVAESKNDFDAARGYYDRVIKLANASDVPGEAARTEAIKATLDGLDDVPELADADTLAMKPRFMTPAPAGATIDGRDLGLPGGNARVLTPEEVEQMLKNQGGQPGAQPIIPNTGPQGPAAPDAGAPNHDDAPAAENPGAPAAASDQGEADAGTPDGR